MCTLLFFNRVISQTSIPALGESLRGQLLSKEEQDILLSSVALSEGFKVLQPDPSSPAPLGQQWIGALLHDAVERNELRYGLSILTEVLLSFSLPAFFRDLALFFLTLAIAAADLIGFARILKENQIYVGYGQP